MLAIISMTHKKLFTSTVVALLSIPFVAGGFSTPAFAFQTQVEENSDGDNTVTFSSSESDAFEEWQEENNTGSGASSDSDDVNDSSDFQTQVEENSDGDNTVTFSSLKSDVFGENATTFDPIPSDTGSSFGDFAGDTVNDPRVSGVITQTTVTTVSQANTVANTATSSNDIQTHNFNTTTTTTTTTQQGPVSAGRPFDLLNAQMQRTSRLARMAALGRDISGVQLDPIQMSGRGPQYQRNSYSGTAIANDSYANVATPPYTGTPGTGGNYYTGSSGTGAGYNGEAYGGSPGLEGYTSYPGSNNDDQNGSTNSDADNASGGGTSTASRDTTDTASRSNTRMADDTDDTSSVGDIEIPGGEGYGDDNDAAIEFSNGWVAVATRALPGDNNDQSSGSFRFISEDGTQKAGGAHYGKPREAILEMAQEKSYLPSDELTESDIVSEASFGDGNSSNDVTEVAGVEIPGDVDTRIWDRAIKFSDGTTALARDEGGGVYRIGDAEYVAEQGFVQDPADNLETMREEILNVVQERKGLGESDIVAEGGF
jgi:hypothetical protein